MSQIQSVDDRALALTPCVETPMMTDASIRSNNILNLSTIERETDKPTEKRLSVKSLVDRFGLIEQKLRSARTNNFDIKKKSFTAACERLCSSYKDCMNMEEGDIQQVENVETFVRYNVKIKLIRY